MKASTFEEPANGRPEPSSALIVHEFGLCNRECSHGEPDAAEVVLCRAWIRRWGCPRQSINALFDSYLLKHAVENASHPRAPLRWLPARYYVTNGAFIRAAQLEGYRVVPCAGGSLNALFDMGFRMEPLPLVEVAA